MSVVGAGDQVILSESCNVCCVLSSFSESVEFSPF